MHRALTIGLVATTGFAAGAITMTSQPTEPAPGVEVFELDDLRERRAESGRAYLGFLDRATLSAGLYRLPGGGSDGQNPHKQDELYFVTAGSGRFTADGQTSDVRDGQVIFVAAGVEHRFHDFDDDLEVLVFFSKAPVDAEP